MARRPAIWQPPKLPGVRTPAFGSRSILQGLLGGPGGRTTLALGRDQRNAILGRTQQPQAPSNPYAGILSDYMNQARADFGAESAADRGSTINAIRKLLISYGASPDFSGLGGLSGDAAGFLKEAMDAKTMGLAAQAEKEGLSSHARLQRANEIATRRIPAELAARGLLRSGQTGADLSEQALSHKQQGYDMLNEVLSNITGGVSAFQNAERERQRQLAQMEMEMAMQAAQDWGDSYFDAEPVAAAVNLAGTPTARSKPYTFKAGKGWGRSVGRTGKDRYGYSPRNPNRPGRPGYRPF